MIVSPEFRRNLWLEITPYRLVGMPLVLGAVFYLAYVSDDYRLAQGVAITASGLFFLICMVWGTKLASETIMNEIRDHTWDGQRMSVITPWQLTWGKLFGSTVFSWYGAIICGVFYGLSSPDGTPLHSVKTLLMLVGAGVLAHAVSLLASLVAIRKERKFNKSQTTAILILGIVVAGPFMGMALGKVSTVTWFGEKYVGADFLLGSILAYATWAVIGVYRMVRLELQMKNAPWIWFCFILFLMTHLAGFCSEATYGGVKTMSAVSPAFLAAYGVAISTVYFMLFAEHKNIFLLQSLGRLAATGNWLRFLERSPRWLLTLPIAALSGVTVIVTAKTNTIDTSLNIVWFVIATLLFLTRDVGIILFCNLAPQTRRADMLSVVYLALLYGIFPAILSTMNLDTATLFFWPRVDLFPSFGCSVAALLETVLVALLVTNRWKKKMVAG